MPLPLFGVPTRTSQPSDAAAVICGNASVEMRSKNDSRDGTVDSPASKDVARQQLDLTRRMTEIWLGWYLREMSVGVANELSQPLAAISGYAVAGGRLLDTSSEDTLSTSSEDAGVVRDALRGISAQALRAGEFIHRLRRLAPPPQPRTALTDVNELVRGIWLLVLGDAAVDKVALKFDAGATLPLVQADAAQIQAVLLNLVRNAIETVAAQLGSRREVTVRTRRTKEGEIEVSVSDSGPGVDLSIADRLFEPFCTTRSDGAGLTLAASRSIIRAHGGTLSYRRKRPRGACFLVRLPGRPQGHDDQPTSTTDHVHRRRR